MRLEWRLGKISAFFSWLDNFFSGIWAWCVDSIVDELGDFTLIGFSYVSLVWKKNPGHIGSVLCILSGLLGHLCVVVVGIEYY